MTPDEIRALYVETLADWFGKRQGCETEDCTGCRDAGRKATAALAEASLLPISTETSRTYDLEDATQDSTIRRYVTAWRGVTE